MTHDEIVGEVRRARQEILDSYGGDVHKMFRDVMKRQWESGHKVVSFPLKREKTAARVAEGQAEYKAGSGKN
jgi:hypothetical protein